MQKGFYPNPEECAALEKLLSKKLLTDEETPIQTKIKPVIKSNRLNQSSQPRKEKISKPTQPTTSAALGKNETRKAHTTLRPNQSKKHQSSTRLSGRPAKKRKMNEHTIEGDVEQAIEESSSSDNSDEIEDSSLSSSESESESDGSSSSSSTTSTSESDSSSSESDMNGDETELREMKTNQPLTLKGDMKSIKVKGREGKSNEVKPNEKGDEQTERKTTEGDDDDGLFRKLGTMANEFGLSPLFAKTLAKKLREVVREVVRDEMSKGEQRKRTRDTAESDSSLDEASQDRHPKKKVRSNDKSLCSSRTIPRRLANLKPTPTHPREKYVRHSGPGVLIVCTTSQVESNGTLIKEGDHFYVLTTTRSILSPDQTVQTSGQFSLRHQFQVRTSDFTLKETELKWTVFHHNSDICIFELFIPPDHVGVHAVKLWDPIYGPYTTRHPGRSTAKGLSYGTDPTVGRNSKRALWCLDFTRELKEHTEGGSTAICVDQPLPLHDGHIGTGLVDTLRYFRGCIAATRPSTMVIHPDRFVDLFHAIWKSSLMSSETNYMEFAVTFRTYVNPDPNNERK